MLNRKLYTLLFLCSFYGLTACSSGSSSDLKNITWQAQDLSTDLERIYRSSCKNCHENSGTGAPLTGDSGTWNKLLEHGLETSIERAINGFGGMPPAGQCFECTPEHFASLIRYMSNPLNTNPVNDNPSNSSQ